MVPVLLALHLLALMFWVGSLVSITRVITSAATEADAVRARLAFSARRIYRSVASPWMGVAVLTGLGLVALHRAVLHQGWFLAKLAGVLVLLVVHFRLGSGVRSAQEQGVSDSLARSTRWLQLGALATAAFTVACAVIWHGLRR